MAEIRAKKALGQHFLRDLSAAERIADALSLEGYGQVLEVGPGTGVLHLAAEDRRNILLANLVDEIGDILGRRLIER